ncbi:MAG: glycoside hydrolase domain-containing protein [Polyangiaceae bacterium]
MKIAPCSVGARGFDTATALDAATVAALKSAGFDFAVRYLGGVDVAEATLILNAGLGLQLVTYSAAPGWTPSAALGTLEGQTDVTQLRALGAPTGLTVWIDLEGAAGDAASVTDWVNARSGVLVSAGFVAGLYVGNASVLDAAALYALPNVSRYWRAFNAGIPEPACGFCQMQLYPPSQVVQGVDVDLDVVQEDYEGRLPTLLVA